MDRERTPWLLVSLHAPWYNSNWAHQGEGNRMKAAMEPLLYAAGVDILFAGHVHAYERSVICWTLLSASICLLQLQSIFTPLLCSRIASIMTNWILVVLFT